jgi:hypothetical protein
MEVVTTMTGQEDVNVVPTTKAVADYVTKNSSGSSNIKTTTEINESSTDDTVPTTKAVYEKLETKLNKSEVVKKEKPFPA